MKLFQLLLACILSISLLVSAYLITDAIKDRNAAENVIDVIGLAQRNVESDLIVWEAKLGYTNNDLISAYAQMKAKSDEIEKLFEAKGIAKTEFTLSAVDVTKVKDLTASAQNPQKTVSGSYRLSQSIAVSSKQVKAVEEVLLLIPEVLKNEVEIISNKPSYYFTHLADLKLSMLAVASQNGLAKAKTIAESSNATVGKLVYSKMGTFQIQSQNGVGKYTKDSTINTTSRIKTVSITVKQKYQIQ